MVLLQLITIIGNKIPVFIFKYLYSHKKNHINLLCLYHVVQVIIQKSDLIITVNVNYIVSIVEVRVRGKSSNIAVITSPLVRELHLYLYICWV